MNKLLSLQALLSGLIDYAGLFPPASLDMSAAVDNYAAYRHGEYSWMLGRFILPLARLSEFENVASFHLRDNKIPWRLSVLIGADLAGDLLKISGFNNRHGKSAIIDTIELKTETVDSIHAASELLNTTLTCYFEIPISADPVELIETMAQVGGRAKVRTGGVTADAFPTSFNLARFIVSCAVEDVPFKATAGLHHPLRSVNKLTYEPDSRTALMHGFLNLFLAAAFAQNAMSEEQLAQLLEENSIDAFKFEDGSITWRGQMAVRGHLRNMRNLFAISFGSCAFEEPIEDLKNLGFEI